MRRALTVFREYVLTLQTEHSLTHQGIVERSKTATCLDTGKCQAELNPLVSMSKGQFDVGCGRFFGHKIESLLYSAIQCHGIDLGERLHVSAYIGMHFHTTASMEVRHLPLHRRYQAEMLNSDRP